jgi:hypothetical protein
VGLRVEEDGLLHLERAEIGERARRRVQDRVARGAGAEAQEQEEGEAAPQKRTLRRYASESGTWWRTLGDSSSMK